MKKSTKFVALSLALTSLLSLTACQNTTTVDEDALQIACTTYPVYLLAQEVTQGVEDVAITLVIDQQVSCLHDYTLTMQDMKAIEAADVLAINGGDMEHFLDDVLDGRTVLDCSEGIELLWNEEEGEPDPHLWMNPERYATMADNLAQGLAQIDPDNGKQYTDNAQTMGDALSEFHQTQLERLQDLSCRSLITFHNGFQYFAEAFDLDIVASVEEEEGAEASAQRIQELAELVEQYHIPAVFTEINGSDAAASTLSAECHVDTFALTLGMSRDIVPESETGLDAYEWIISYDIDTLLEAYA